MLTSYERRGIEIGFDQGKRDSLIRLMRRKYGDLPDDVVHRIEATTDRDQLDRIMDRVIDTANLRELDLTEA